MPQRAVLCLRETGVDGFDPDPGCVRTGGNSGYQAIHLAAHAGATRILLFGFDLGGGHWHGDHPAPLSNPATPAFAAWLRHFETLVEPLHSRGVHVINCTPQSALQCWPMADPNDMLRAIRSRPARLEKHTMDTIRFDELPRLGAAILGGLFAGLTTTSDGAHAAVVLLADKPAGRVTWDGAQAWAAGVGGQLPSRPVAALLYANVRGEFEPAWHWTAEEEGASFAWLCRFLNGYQSYYLKSFEGCARAVRMVPLTA